MGATTFYLLELEKKQKEEQKKKEVEQRQLELEKQLNSKEVEDGGEGPSQEVDTEGQKIEEEQTEKEEVIDLNFHELRRLAKEQEIEGYGQMNKQELIEALKG